MALVEPIAQDADLDRTVALLGGQRTLHRTIQTPLDTHDLLQDGLPVRALNHLVSGVHILHSDHTMELAVGISSRTYYRRKKDVAGKPLNREQSGRVWKFAEILARATELFGSQDAAERWLEAPAMGLDQRRPIDLLSTPVGVDTLETYLTRIEYGVYA